MFFFKKTDGEELKVAFMYERREVFPKKKEKEEKKAAVQRHPFKSKCLITSGGVLKAFGETTLHPKDRFRYDKGRRWAMKYALQNGKFNKEDRAKAWKALLEMENR
ncbi:MAG: hypothetical protein DRI61_15050 [Chloroflexi bacterium]|nr:MAG: hypothetical protein DRI61_15050 [Chloroflexota bacterium]